MRLLTENRAALFLRPNNEVSLQIVPDIIFRSKNFLPDIDLKFIRAKLHLRHINN